MKLKPLDILYVEDDEMDVDLAKTAMQFVCDKERFKMQIVDDGEKAIQFLNRSEPYANAPAPDVILLDLNLPRVHGRDVLKTIKQSDRFKKIPVIVLTTSQRQEDIDESYMLGANGYLSKPNELAEYQRTFKAICEFWFNKASLPTRIPS